MGYAVEMKSIKKSFGANYVLKEVDFALEKGSIHALLGENGAGKSTLMNILGGVLPRDGGTVCVEGDDVAETVGSRIIEEKVAFIHQELSLINDLNIFENLYLVKEIKRGVFLDKKTMRARTAEVLGRMGVTISPDTMVDTLNPSYKQITEIARAMLKDARVIIMDEPTTSLTDVETEFIFEVMRALRNQGISLIFISHKLNEVLAVCDSYTILRDGEVVAVGKVQEGLTEKDLSTHMVGQEVKTEGIYQPREVGETVLEIQNLSKEREFSNVSMYLRRGEILGVTGLMGDGRTELFAAVYGANYPYQGKVIVEGREVTMRSTGTALRNRIAYVPKNRKENGIIHDLNIQENMGLPVLGRLSRFGIMQGKMVRGMAENYVKKLEIKVGELENLITSLSGGNQQKVVLSKALGTEPRVLILDNPTQGVDVGAKMEIYRQIIKLAEQGFSFIVLTNEVPELQRTCDRAYVMFHGEVRQEFSRDEMTEENIMHIATGGKMEG